MGLAQRDRGDHCAEAAVEYSVARPAPPGQTDLVDLDRQHVDVQVGVRQQPGHPDEIIEHVEHRTSAGAEPGRVIGSTWAVAAD